MERAATRQASNRALNLFFAMGSLQNGVLYNTTTQPVRLNESLAGPGCPASNQQQTDGGAKKIKDKEKRKNGKKLLLVAAVALGNVWAITVGDDEQIHAPRLELFSIYLFRLTFVL